MLHSSCRPVKCIITKNGLTRETQRDATSGEVRHLKEENEALKRAVAEMVLENQKLKKSMGL